MRPWASAATANTNLFLSYSCKLDRSSDDESGLTVDRPDNTLNLVFEVEDTGVGMAEESCAKLFSLFTKISDTRVANPTGSGLGLAICKDLVKLMHGSIKVTSVYGKGSTFTFNIRVEPATADDLEQVRLPHAAAATSSHLRSVSCSTLLL
jgi:signal transduction histidine kinase